MADGFHLFQRSALRVVLSVHYYCSSSGLRIKSAHLWIITTTSGNYEGDIEILERRKQIKQHTMFLQRKQNRSLLLAENAGKVYIGAEALS